MRPFHDPIWRSRLEVLWVVYAATYLFVGAFTQERIASSILALIGGVLVAAVFAHILLEENQDKSRPLLLIALAVSVFVMNESANTFEDYLATIFASIFGLMLIRLLWNDDEGESRQATKYRYFCTMSLVLVSGIVGLVITVAIQQIERFMPSMAGSLVFAPLGTMALVALSTGLTIGERGLPENLPGVDHRLNKSNGRIILEIIFVSSVAAVLICIFNEQTILQKFNDKFAALPAAFVQALALAIVPVLVSFQSLRFRLAPSATFFGRAPSMFALYAVIAVVNAAVLHVVIGGGFKEPEQAFERLLLVEAPIAFGYGASVFIWWMLTRRIAIHMYYGRVRST